MTIRITNATFESSSAGDYDTLDIAFSEALTAGADIAIQELRDGSKSAIVEIAVDLVGQRAAARGAVSVASERFAVLPAT